MNPYLLGLDVSKWQSGVNWTYAKTQGVQYAFIKAQEWYFTDPQFLNHWSGSLAAGVLRGAYLYYRDALIPETQAQKFHELLASTGDMGELPPVLDIETYNNPTLTPSKIKKCLETMAALFGRAPIFYSRNDVVQTLGNPSWLLAYPLWLAQYTLIGWQTDHFEKVKQYPPTIPSPYPFYWVWQFSDKCPAATFQVTGSATVDTNYAPEEIINAWAGQLPPPDPEPIGEYMYTADVVYLAPGTTYRNIRSKPDSIAPDIGIDVGDVVITDKKLPVYEVQTNGEGDWYHLKKGNTVGWVLGKVGSTEYLKLTPLVPMKQVTAAKNVNLWYWKDKNAQGKPIMIKPDNPSKFLLGATFIVDPVKVDADGDDDYYHVLNPLSASPPALTPPAPWTGWCCKVGDVF